jgi:hypothetical protein
VSEEGQRPVASQVGSDGTIKIGDEEGNTPGARPKRTVKCTELLPAERKTVRRPVGQRWYYEPVKEIPLLLTMTGEEQRAHNTENDADENGDPSRQGESQSPRPEAQCTEERRGEDILRDQRGGKTSGSKDDVAKENKNFSDGFPSDIRDNKSLFDDFSDNRDNSDNSVFVPYGLKNIKLKSNFSRNNTGFVGPSVFDGLSTVGTLVQLPCQVLEDAADDEFTACSVQGLVFHDEELGWCIVTNWGVDYGTNIIYYTPITSTNPAIDEQHVALSEFLSVMRSVPVVPRISNYRATRRLAELSCKRDGVYVF